MVSIAVTFLPSTRRRIDQVLEAQAIRGHRLTGLRDWAPLVMPLLIGGLESAMQLAETMTARGFASSAAGSTGKTRTLISVGMVLVAAGWILGLLQVLQIPGAVLLVGGLALIGAALRQVGSQMPRTAHKKEPWVVQDTLLAGAYLGLIALALLGPPQSISSTLNYQPYPEVTLPGFEVAIGLLIQALLLPILTRRNRRA